MGRRGDNIFQRKDGRWEARYAVGKDNRGSTKYRSVYGKTYSEAKEKRRSEMQKMYVPKSTGLFSDVIERWMQEKETELKEQTIRKYRLCIETHILPYFGRMRLTSVSESIVEEFLKEKRQCGRADGKGGLSQNTVRGISIILQAILNFAYDRKFDLSCAIKIKKPKNVKKTVSVLKLDEQRRLEKALLEDPHNENLAIYLALCTGLRIGEVCALRWQDVDFAGRRLHVSSTVVRNRDGAMTIDTPKSETSIRTIPTSSVLLQLLKGECRHSSSSYLFTAPKKGTFLNPRTLQYQFKALLKRCSLPAVTFHALRHTFATRWIECGMDVKSLSEVLGHASVQITLDIYVHSSEQRKREAIEKITGQISGQETAESIV